MSRRFLGRVVLTPDVRQRLFASSLNEPFTIQAGDLLDLTLQESCYRVRVRNVAVHADGDVSVECVNEDVAVTLALPPIGVA